MILMLCLRHCIFLYNISIISSNMQCIWNNNITWYKPEDLKLSCTLGLPIIVKNNSEDHLSKSMAIHVLWYIIVRWYNNNKLLSEQKKANHLAVAYHCLHSPLDGTLTLTAGLQLTGLEWQLYYNRVYTSIHPSIHP